MASKVESPTMLAAHGASRLTEVDVDDYNAEISDKDGFVGDRASGRAFRAVLEAAREPVRKRHWRRIAYEPYRGIGDPPDSRLVKAWSMTSTSCPSRTTRRGWPHRMPATRTLLDVRRS